MDNSAKAREVSTMIDKLCMYHIPSLQLKQKGDLVECLMKIVSADLMSSAPEEETKICTMISHKGISIKQQPKYLGYYQLSCLGLSH